MIGIDKWYEQLKDNALIIDSNIHSSKDVENAIKEKHGELNLHQPVRGWCSKYFNNNYFFMSGMNIDHAYKRDSIGTDRWILLDPDYHKLDYCVRQYKEDMLLLSNKYPMEFIQQRIENYINYIGSWCDKQYVNRFDIFLIQHGIPKNFRWDSPYYIFIQDPDYLFKKGKMVEITISEFFMYSLLGKMEKAIDIFNKQQQVDYVSYSIGMGVSWRCIKNMDVHEVRYDSNREKPQCITFDEFDLDKFNFFNDVIREDISKSMIFKYATSKKAYLNHKDLIDQRLKEKFDKRNIIVKDYLLVCNVI